MRRRIKKGLAKIVLTLALSSIGSIGACEAVSEGHVYAERHNVYKGLYNLVMDTYCWVDRCFDPNYKNKLEREKKTS